MAEYLTRVEENGTVNIAEDVVAVIVADAMKQVEGVCAASQSGDHTGKYSSKSGKKAARSVHVEKLEDSIVVDLCLITRYGYAIPEVAQKVQECVTAAVLDVTGIPVKEVNVHVSGICFND